MEFPKTLFKLIEITHFHGFLPKSSPELNYGAFCSLSCCKSWIQCELCLITWDFLHLLVPWRWVYNDESRSIFWAVVLQGLSTFAEGQIWKKNPKSETQLLCVAIYGRRPRSLSTHTQPWLGITCSPMAHHGAFGKTLHLGNAPNSPLDILMLTIVKSWSFIYNLKKL